jgi:hypothetical protein
MAMKKIILTLSAVIMLLLGALIYVYIALPLIWPSVYSDLRHLDVRGKMYHFSKLETLKKKAAFFEEQGKKNIAANQIIHEVHWLCNCTRDFKRIDKRLQDLRIALEDTMLIGMPDEQSPEDGSWGKWYTEWFFKLDATYEQIIVLAREGKVPHYPVRFLDSINTPEKLISHLNNLLVSKPDRDGIDRGREMNETLSALVRMIMLGQPANYVFDPQLKTTLVDFIINKVIDPETGYLAYQYLADDKIRKRLSMSMTFHVVGYLDPVIINWQKLITTMLNMKDKEFKEGGWLDNGAYTNHHNMDVVELFRLGWPYLTPAQHDAMRIEIRKMLTWCLKESLLSDGSFRKMKFENDSIEEYICYGASFLARAGYFNTKKRFWTNEEFPESTEVKARIVKYIREHFDAGGAGGTYYLSALERMGEKL